MSHRLGINKGEEVMLGNEKADIFTYTGSIVSEHDGCREDKSRIKVDIKE